MSSTCSTSIRIRSKTRTKKLKLNLSSSESNEFLMTILKRLNNIRDGIEEKEEKEEKGKEKDNHEKEKDNNEKEKDNNMNTKNDFNTNSKIDKSKHILDLITVLFDFKKIVLSSTCNSEIVVEISIEMHRIMNIIISDGNSSSSSNAVSLLSDVYNFYTTICIKLHILYNEQFINILILDFIRWLSYNNSSKLISECLKSISSLTFNHSNILELSYPNLIPLLILYVNKISEPKSNIPNALFLPSSANLEIGRYAITALGNLCRKSKLTLNSIYFVPLFESLASIISYCSRLLNNSAYIKVIATSVRSMFHLLSERNIFSNPSISPHVVTVLTNFLKLIAVGTQHSSSDINSGIESDSSVFKYSDSELNTEIEPDIDNNPDGKTIGSYEQVRYWSITLIGLISRMCKSAVYRTLALILPAEEKEAVSRIPFSGPSLLTCILYDSSPRIRSAACLALCFVLEDSPLAKWVGPLEEGSNNGTAGFSLNTKRNRPRTTSQVENATVFASSSASLSGRISGILKALYNVMLIAFERETHFHVQACVLKCTSTLINHTPQAHLSSSPKFLEFWKSIMKYSEKKLEQCILEKATSSFLNNVLPPFIPRSTNDLPPIPVTLGENLGFMKQSIFSCLLSIFSSKQEIRILSDLLNGEVEIEEKFDSGILPSNSSLLSLLLNDAFTYLPSEAQHFTSYLQDIASGTIKLTSFHQNAKTLPSPNSISVLARMTRNYNHILENYWDTPARSKSLLHLFIGSFYSSEPHVLLDVLKIAEEWITSEQGNRKFFDLAHSYNICSTMLPVLFNKIGNATSISYLINIKTKILLLIGFVCSNKNLWSQLSNTLQHCCFSVLLSGLKDSQPAIRAVASKTIGHSSLVISFCETILNSHSPSFFELNLNCEYPNRFSQLSSFFTVLSSLLVTLIDAEELGSIVRVKAAGSLANISTLPNILKKDPFNINPFDIFTEKSIQISYSIFFKNAVIEPEKVQSNSIRGLGNLSFWILESNDFDKYYSLICEVFSVYSTLISDLKVNPKAKWNAAVASGNIISNINIFSYTKFPIEVKTKFNNSLTMLLDSLINSVSNSENYKVRIHSSVALCALSNRSMYLESFEKIVFSFTNVLIYFEKQQIKDFADFQYKESLKNQISLSLLHIIGFIDIEVDFNDTNSTLALFFTQNLLFFADWLRLLSVNDISSNTNESDNKLIVADNDEDEQSVARVSSVLITPAKVYEIVSAIYLRIDSLNSNFNFDIELKKLNEKLISALSVNPFGFNEVKSPSHGQEWKSTTSYLDAFKQIYNLSNDLYIPIN